MLVGTFARVRAVYRERRAVRWTVELLLLLMVVLAISAFQTRDHLRDVPVPALSLRSVAGESVALESFKGKKTLVYVWAPWCGVCKLEASNISRVQSMLGDRARVVSIVSSYESLDEVKREIADKGIDYPVLLGDDALERSLRVSVFPTVYFLDEQGRIMRSVSGYTTTVGLLSRLYLP